MNIYLIYFNVNIFLTKILIEYIEYSNNLNEVFLFCMNIIQYLEFFKKENREKSFFFLYIIIILKF